MMRYQFFIFFFILAGTALPGQQLALKQQEKGIPASVAAYELLIKYYRYYKQDSAVYFVSKALNLARQLGDSNGVALILIQSGMIDDNQGDFEESEKKYRQALNIFSALESKQGTATAFIRLGVVELRNGKYDVAIKHFLDALKISEQTGDKFGIMESNYSISWAYLDQKNYSTALGYLQIAERYNDSLPFSNLTLNIYNHFGVIYRELKNYQKAKNYLNKGIKQSDKLEYQGLNITLINNLAAVYAKEGLKEKAIKLQEEALQRSRNIGNYLRELQTLYGLARTYGKENPTKAIDYLRQAVSLARKKAAYKQEMRYLKTLAELYIEQGDFRQAFLAKEREYALADSFFYKKTSQNIVSLKAEYELSKSNARIKELNLLNNKRQLELDKSNLVRNVTIAGIILLMIILALLYNQYRIKQRNAKEIEHKNESLQHLLDEKEWLLKEVHHRVKNNLHTIMSLLETQSAYLEKDALIAVQNSQHRVYAMSLIHQKLYQHDNTTIDMSVYLPELINYLRDSFDVWQRIRFTTHIENILLDISQAIPVGLILNEAITNAIKYAFPGEDPGVIDISMITNDDKKIVLSVTDNGVGLPPGREHIKNNSLGLKLMRGLSEDIHARFNIESMKGTKVTVEFKAAHFRKNNKGKIKIMQIES